MTRALLATDGSEFACRALRGAVALLDPFTELTVLCVARVPVPVDVPALGVAATSDTVREEALEDARRWAAEAVATTVDHLGVRAREDVRVGSPGETVCRVAADEGYDLIVLGSHGSGLLKRMFVGSVSHHVLHHAPCPVLMVRDGELAAGGG
jgi:nucleotide-binding universal stress UspA family protein